MVSMQDYIKHYDDHYKAHGLQGSGTGEYEIKLRLWREIGYTDGMTVLDYGCGWGAMLPGITNKEGYCGVDVSAEAIRIGRQKFPGVWMQDFVPGELQEFITRKHQFDFVCAQSVFTHTPKHSVLTCLKDIKDVMSGFALIDILIGDDQPDNIHVRYYKDEDEWFWYLDKAGLKGEFVKNIQWPGGLHYYYKVTKKELEEAKDSPQEVRTTQ